MTLEQRELEALQRRIEWQRAQYEREEIDLQPVAVSVNGGKLMYGELDLILPEPAITAYGQVSEHFIGTLGEWRIEIDGFVQPVHDIVPVSFGDTRSQPYEGNAFITSVEPRPITGEWFTNLQSTGPLTYNEESEPDRG